LLPESKIAPYYLFSKRIGELQQEQATELWQVLRGLSHQIPSFDKDGAREVITEFKNRFERNPWFLNKERTEDLYPSILIDEYHQADPLRVDLHYDFMNRFKKTTLKPDSPHERAVARLWDWFSDNYQKILDGEEYELPPTDIIEDDPILIEAIARTPCTMVGVVTDDKRMVNLARRRLPGKIIARISVRNWVQQFDALESNFVNPINERYRSLRSEILIDHGSIEANMPVYSARRLEIDMLRFCPFNEEQVRIDPATQMSFLTRYQPPRNINSGNILDFIEITKDDHWNLERIRRGMWRDTVDQSSSVGVINREQEVVGRLHGRGPFEPP
jgi:hypothetical protein